MLLMAAMLMSINQLQGGLCDDVDDGFIEDRQADMAQAQESITRGKEALQEHDLSTAVEAFIDGYWKFRKVMTDIWYEADPCDLEDTYCTFSLNGRPYVVNNWNSAGDLGSLPSSNIWLGHWLKNMLLGASPVAIFSGNKDCFGGQKMCCGIKDYSPFIKKTFVKSFNHPRIKNMRDCGNWLQNNYCKPVSECLLEFFNSAPKEAHEFISTLELYKCYIECDGNAWRQKSSSQYNYDAVHAGFYTWFFDIIKSALAASENSEIHTVLLAVFYNWDAKMSDFVDTVSMPNERIRGMGGYQIEAPKIREYFQNPNVQSQLIVGEASQAQQLDQQIKAFSTAYAVKTKQATEVLHTFNVQ